MRENSQPALADLISTIRPFLYDSSTRPMTKTRDHTSGTCTGARLINLMVRTINGNGDEGESPVWRRLCRSNDDL